MGVACSRPAAPAVAPSVAQQALLAPATVSSDAPAAAEPALPPMPSSARMEVMNAEEAARIVMEARNDPARTAIVHRRIVRLLSLVCCMGLLASSLTVFHLPVSSIRIEREWDANRPLLIEVHACDVAVEPAPASAAPTIVFNGLASGTALLKWITSQRGASHGRVLVEGLQTRSTTSCARLPFLSCSTACRIVVRVPDGVEPRELHVSQDLEDKSPIVQLRLRDVSLRTLRVRGAAGMVTWSSAGPSIAVHAARTTFLAGVLVNLVAGDFRCDECAISADAQVQVISTSGSVTIDSALLPSAADPAGALPSSLRLALRQPMDYACIAAEAPTRIDEPDEPWALCEGEYHAKGTFALFDADRDAFVNRQELLDGLGAIPICCGAANCPYAGWCDPFSWTLFPSVVDSPSDSGLTGRADVLTNAAFLARLRARNLTNLVPRCARLYTLRLRTGAEPEATNAPPAPYWGPIVSEGGQVSVVLRAPPAESTWTSSRALPAARRPRSSTAFPPRTALGENGSATFSAPAGRYGGIRMLHDDARRLREEVGAEYGDATSVGSAFIIFDVPAAPGIPRSLWVYSPLPVYFILPPATLAHLSLGSMVPKLVRYRVRFHDSACAPAQTDYVPVNASCAASYQPEALGHDAECEDVRYADHDARLAAVHDGLARAIKSNGLDARRPRGDVLLVLPDQRPESHWWEFLPRGADYALAQVTRADYGSAGESTVEGQVLMSHFSAPQLSATVHAAVLMSLLASFVVALFAQAALYVAAREVMRTAWKDKRSKQRMFRKFGLVSLPTDGVESQRPADAAGPAGGGGGDGAAAPAAADGADGAERERLKVIEPTFSVFEVPLVFISTLFVEPLQRQYIDSVKAFIRDRCHVDRPPPPPWVRKLADQLERARRFALRIAEPAASAAAAAADAPRAGSIDGAAGEPLPPTEAKSSMVMADLVFQYELYCFQRGLEVVSSREALQRSLIRHFNCRVHASSAVLYVGCRWKYADEAAGASASRIVANLRPSRPELSPSMLFDDYKKTIGAFLNEHLVVDRQPTSSVLAERPERDGSRTFGAELSAFCAAHERREPSNVAVLYELANRGITITKLRKRTVYGLRLDEAATNMLSSDRTVVEVLTVLFHFVLMFMPGLLILCVALFSQEVFAHTTATRMPLMWQHYFAIQEPERSFFTGAFFSAHGPQLAAAVRVEVFELCVFGAATLLHMVIHYMDSRAVLPRLFQRLYGVIFWVHTMALLLHVSLTASWCLLAAVLDPTHFLPTGTAIVVAIIVVSTTRRQLGAAAGRLRLALTHGFEQRLQKVLHRALELGLAAQLKAQKAEVLEIGLSANQLLLPDGGSLLNDGAAGLLTPRQAQGAEKDRKSATTEAALKGTGDAQGEAARRDTAQKLLPSDVFNMLAKGSKSSKSGLETALDVAEFEALFDKLDLDISRARREQLFAYMDMSGDGRISQKEFEDGWDFLVTLLVEEAVDSAGVSPGQITLSIAGLIVWLLFLFAFIFLAIQGWFRAGSFESAIQSMFIGVTGFLTQRLRSRTKAERSDEGEFRQYVKNFVISGTKGNDEFDDNYTQDKDGARR